jgi:hypothetical protein
MDPFKLAYKEQTKNKIFSMEVGGKYVLTGHDRNLSLRETKGKFERVWEKRPDPSRKVVPDHLKVMLDDQGKVAVTSTTDKQLTIFDCVNGKLLCKA